MGCPWPVEWEVRWVAENRVGLCFGSLWYGGMVSGLWYGMGWVCVWLYKRGEKRFDVGRVGRVEVIHGALSCR